MKTLHQPPRILNNAIWEFYFQLVFISPANGLIFCLSWALEKLDLIIPSLLYIFNKSDLGSAFNFLNSFNAFFLGKQK